MFPDPGAVVSILLLFPIIIFGSRIAGASPIEKTRGRRIAAGIVLGICALLTAIILPLALITFLVILFYGIFCGIQVMRRGQGRKRWLIGAIVIAWTGFAIADFLASFGSHGNFLGHNEASAVGTLRRLSVAEGKFSDPASSGSAKVARYGTIEDLRKNQMIDNELQLGNSHEGYVFRELVDPAKRQFLFYAVPVHLPPSESEPAWTHLLPGSSLYFYVWYRDKTQGTGLRSFAVDESGSIRFTAEPTKLPVTRDEVTRWYPL